MRPPKRSRVSKPNNTCVLDQPNSAESVSSGILPKPIFTLGSPVKNHQTRRMKFGGGFLKHCFCCKELIGEQDEIFMYSASAFCSPACRDMQIGMDRKFELTSVKESISIRLGFHKRNV